MTNNYVQYILPIMSEPSINTFDLQHLLNQLSEYNRAYVKIGNSIYKCKPDEIGFRLTSLNTNEDFLCNLLDLLMVIQEFKQNIIILDTYTVETFYNIDEKNK